MSGHADGASLSHSHQEEHLVRGELDTVHTAAVRKVVVGYPHSIYGDGKASLRCSVV